MHIRLLEQTILGFRQFKRSVPAAVLAALSILALTGTNDIRAEEREAWRDDPLGNKFVFAVGLFSPKLDTTGRRDSSSGLVGTVIDFETTLGMDERDQLPLIMGYYRAAKKHRISYQYFRLNRNGNSVSDLPIRFGEVVFPANLPLSSYFDVDVCSLSYSYFLIHDQKKELALSLGLKFQDIQLG